MRKGLALFLSLLLLASCGVGVGIWSIMKDRENVIYYPTEEQGDRGALAGLTIRQTSNLWSKVRWQNTVSFTEDAHTVRTDYGFHPLGFPNETAVGDNTGVIDGDFYYRPQSWDDFLLEQMGDEDYFEGKIDLHDFADYWYLDGYFSINGYTIAEEWGEQKLEQYLRIPIPEGSYITVEAERGKDSNHISYFTTSVEDYTPPYLETVTAGNYVYLWLLDPTGLDLSQIPGGYGIYRLPVESVEDGTEQTVNLLYDQMDTLYSFPENSSIMGLWLDEETGRINYLRMEAGMTLLLEQVDINTGELLQSIPMGGSGGYPVTQEDDLVVCHDDEVLCAAQRQPDGSWEKVLTCPAPEDVFEDVALWSFSPDWDGERLILATVTSDCDTANGFLLQVFTEEGLTYQGRYNSTLDQTNVSDDRLWNENARVSAEYDFPVEVSWG